MSQVVYRKDKYGRIGIISVDKETTQFPNEREIEIIFKSAFENCKQLTNCIIPEGVTHIGEKAFKGCENLQNIVLPSSLIYIGKEAFYGCKKLKVLIFPEKIKNIGQKVFYESGIEKVYIPCSYHQDVDNGIFINCLHIKLIEYYHTDDFNLRDLHIEFNPLDFENSLSYPYIVIPKSGDSYIQTINGIFLESFDYEDYLDYYPSTLMTAVLIPSRVSSLPDTVEALGPYCFGPSQKELKLPRDIEYISYNAFDFSTNLERILIHEDTKDHVLKLLDGKIPEYVKFKTYTDKFSATESANNFKDTFFETYLYETPKICLSGFIIGDTNASPDLKTPFLLEGLYNVDNEVV